MTMSEWAKNEVDYAIEASGDGDCGYYADCCRSALKAFESLCEDGHSDFSSIKVTQNILSRLIDGRPIISIWDDPKIWKETFSNEDTKTKSYQCTRMMSLFKDIHEDGTVYYNDVERTVMININDGTIWYNGLADNLVDELYPITMPYMPFAKPFKIYAEEYLTDHKNGDYDTVGFRYLLTPVGEKVELNRYFKDSDGPMVEIDKEEFEERKAMHEARVKKESENKDAE